MEPLLAAAVSLLPRLEAPAMRHALDAVGIRSAVDVLAMHEDDRAAMDGVPAAAWYHLDTTLTGVVSGDAPSPRRRAAAPPSPERPRWDASAQRPRTPSPRCSSGSSVALRVSTPPSLSARGPLPPTPLAAEEQIASLTRQLAEARDEIAELRSAAAAAATAPRNALSPSSPRPRSSPTRRYAGVAAVVDSGRQGVDARVCCRTKQLLQAVLDAPPTAAAARAHFFDAAGNCGVCQRGARQHRSVTSRPMLGSSSSSSSRRLPTVRRRALTGDLAASPSSSPVRSASPQRRAGGTASAAAARADLLAAGLPAECPLSGFPAAQTRTQHVFAQLPGEAAAAHGDRFQHQFAPLLQLLTCQAYGAAAVAAQRDRGANLLSLLLYGAEFARFEWGLRYAGSAAARVHCYHVVTLGDVQSDGPCPLVAGTTVRCCVWPEVMQWHLDECYRRRYVAAFHGATDPLTDGAEHDA
jgi:hypothetical protein